MARRVCPWWLGYFLLNPLRRISQNPKYILQPYVREGMVVLEPGPGMGFFTLELARQVGSSGRVVAVDVQPRMLRGLKRRASRNGLADRIDARLVPQDCICVPDLAGKVDFVLAFAVVHETPSATAFFASMADALKPGGCLFLAEPRGHVKDAEFQSELKAAAAAGLDRIGNSSISRSYTALLKKRPVPAAAD